MTQSILNQMNPGCKPMGEVLMQNVTMSRNQCRVKTLSDVVCEIPGFHRIDQKEFDRSVVPFTLEKVPGMDSDAVFPRSNSGFKRFQKTISFLVSPIERCADYSL